MPRPTLDRQNRSERFNMFITKAELEAIEDWRFANRIPSLSEAVRQLIAAGLEAKSEKGGAS